MQQEPYSDSRVVYVATSGEYSDYEVVAVFARREDADQSVALGMADNVNEETLYVEMPQVHLWYRAQMTKRQDDWVGRPAGFLDVSEHGSLTPMEHKPDEYSWAFVAQGPDRERVIKSVSDRYAAWKAGQEGL